MYYDTLEEANAAFERLLEKGVINYSYYVTSVDGYYVIETWDYNEEW